MKIKDIFYYGTIFIILWATTFFTRFVMPGEGLHSFTAMFCMIVFRCVVTFYLSAFFIGVITKKKAKRYWHLITAFLTGTLIPAFVHFADCCTYAYITYNYKFEYIFTEGMKMFLAFYDNYAVLVPILCELAFVFGVYALTYVGIRNRWISAIVNRFGWILDEDVATVKTNVISFPEDFDMVTPRIGATQDGRLIVIGEETFYPVMRYYSDLLELDALDDTEATLLIALDGSKKADMLNSKDMIIPEEIRESVYSEEYEIIRSGNLWELIPISIENKNSL